MESLLLILFHELEGPLYGHPVGSIWPAFAVVLEERLLRSCCVGMHPTRLD
jgi:hypothetical protein